MSDPRLGEKELGMSVQELPEWARTLTVFDTETTGIDTDADRIVTATIAVIDQRGEMLEQNSWLLNPEYPISPKAVQVHGITNEIAQSQGQDRISAIAQISSKVLELGNLYPVVAFNAAFDFSILRSECLRTGAAFALPSLILDPLVLDKGFDKFRRGSRTLIAAAAHYGVPFENAHDATADAVAGGRVAQALFRKYQLTVPDNLMSLQSTWKRAQAASFEVYKRRQGDQSFTVNGGWPLLDSDCPRP